jgi:hypothetical protein
VKSEIIDEFGGLLVKVGAIEMGKNYLVGKMGSVFKRKVEI